MPLHQKLYYITWETKLLAKEKPFFAKNHPSEEILLFCTAFPFLARFNAKNFHFGNF